MGKGIGFRRIRRVTGYLTGDVKFIVLGEKTSHLKERK